MMYLREKTTVRRTQNLFVYRYCYGSCFFILGQLNIQYNEYGQ